MSDILDLFPQTAFAAGTSTGVSKTASQWRDAALFLRVATIDAGATLDFTIEGSLDKVIWGTIFTVPQITTANAASECWVIPLTGVVLPPNVRGKRVTAGGNVNLTADLFCKTREAVS